MVDDGRGGEVMQHGPEAMRAGKEVSDTQRPLASRCFRWDTGLERKTEVRLQVNVNTANQSQNIIISTVVR